MSNYGIKVSKDGYSVLTATILQQTFNSDYTCLKMLPVVSFSNTNSGTRTFTVGHGLSYKPSFLTFAEYGDSGKWLFDGVFTTANDIDLVFSITTSGSQKVDVVCFLFVDPGE